MLATSNLFLHLLGFAYRTVLSRVAGAEGMGVYTLVMQVYFILYSVSLSGVCVAVSAIAARLTQAENHKGLRALVRLALVAFFVVFCIAASPVLLFPDFIAGSLLGDLRTVQALYMLLACIFLTGIENVAKAVFHGSGKVTLPIFSEVGEQTLRIAFVLLLLGRFANDDYGHTAFLIIVGMTLSEVYSASFLMINFWRKFRGRGRRDAPVPGLRQEFSGILLPAAGTSVISNMFASVGTILFPARLVVAGFTRSAAVAALGIVAGMAAPLIQLPICVIASLSTLLLPSVAAARAAGDAACVRRRIRKALLFTASVALPVTAVLLPFVPKLCLLLFNQRIGPTLALLLAVHAGITYFLMVSVSILNGLGEQRRVLVYAILGETLQLGLIWLLAAVPELHVYGYLAGLILGDLLRLVCNLRRVHVAVFRKV